MASAKDQRQCWLMLWLFVYKVCLPDSVQIVALSGNESRIVERISRRQNDIYYIINSTSTSMNCGDKDTYLISDDQCVKNLELFRGCNEAIVPISSSFLTATTFFDSSMTITYLLGERAKDFTQFIFNETNQLVNSSLCCISSLEVYRGRQQAIEISHQGFSLTNNGSVKIAIEPSELGYDLEDYVGELYRMNLSCNSSGEGPPESGCLFFKVRNQTSAGYVTNAKFNCTVPGTLYDFIEECKITTNSIAANTPKTNSGNSKVTPSYTITLEPGDEPMIANLDVIYVLAGLGGGILILTILVITVCTIFFCLQLAKRKRQMLTLTVDLDPPHNVYTLEEDEQPHGIDGELLENNEHPITSRPTVLSRDLVILSEDTDHVYAVLEQTHQQQPILIVQRNETTLIEQAQQTQILQEAVPSDDFQHGTNQTVGLKSRSATWASAQQAKLRPNQKPRHENLELIQIYDNVIVEPKGRAIARDMDTEASTYPRNYRKHSLPAKLGEHLDPMVTDASQDCPASNGPHETADESIPMRIYSKPDMNKKREERQRKREQREQEERMAALQNDVSSSSGPPQATELESEPWESNTETSTDTGSGVMTDGQQQTDSETVKQKFGKQLLIIDQDKVPQGNDECLYDTPTSLDLIPKRSQNITQRKEKEDDERDLVGES